MENSRRGYRAATMVIYFFLVQYPDHAWLILGPYTLIVVSGDLFVTRGSQVLEKGGLCDKSVYSSHFKFHVYTYLCMDTKLSPRWNSLSVCLFEPKHKSLGFTLVDCRLANNISITCCDLMNSHLCTGASIGYTQLWVQTSMLT